ncbi:hypothetical protein [Micromonospora sp. 15K316]|uniref:hypothetical protein n=1 Tax=Micromonospora sp. 15K316 TaxID=2530376 RepID=UPI001404FB4F|nr:hypothetical protein [Micromonospora sp. 15K316]
MIGVGLVLIVSALTAPKPDREPLRLEWRPATDVEQQQHDRARLWQAMDELRP